MTIGGIYNDLVINAFRRFSTVSSAPLRSKNLAPDAISEQLFLCTSYSMTP